MRALRKLFENPPKGGNEVGVPTASSMAPLPNPTGTTVDPFNTGPRAQTSLPDSFAAGVRASKTHATQSGKVGQPEFRNFDRGRLVPGMTDREQAYDAESMMTGHHGTVGEVPVAPQGDHKTPRPQLRPDTSMPYRSDGKPNYKMGVKPSQYYDEFSSDRDRDDDDIDRNGGI